MAGKREKPGDIVLRLRRIEFLYPNAPKADYAEFLAAIGSIHPTIAMSK